MWHRLSFKLKLTLSFIFVILFSFGFIAFYLDKNLEENALQELKSSLVNQAYLVENQISPESFKKEDLAYLNNLVKNLSPKIKCRLTLINSQGKVLADSEKPSAQVLEMENHAGRPEIEEALAGNIGEEIHYSSTLKIDMLYIALPIKKEGQALGAVRLALPLASVKRMLFSIKKAVFLSLFFALGLAFVLGSLLTRGMVRPINRVIHICRKFSNGDFSQRIYYESKDEIGELSATLNSMAKELEEKIKAAEVQAQKLEAIFQSMAEGIVVADKSGRIVSVNSAAEKIFNIKKGDAEGKLFLEAIPNNDIAEIIGLCLGKKEFVSRELSLVWPLEKIFRIDASPIFEKGSITGCVAVIHDITHIRKLETVRRDFVANVSHELKTPLTSIKGFVETLLEGGLEDKKNSRHFLEIIQDHANRLDNLLNDLLSLSGLESKEIALEKTAFNLKDLSDEILLGFKSQLKKKSIEAKNDLASGLVINADKFRIEQVLVNLIDNAIKFNRQNGSIRFYCEDLKDKIKIIIEDAGVGIPAKDTGRIFERFYRVDKARSRELGGTGLGLSIVKHIIELHTGSVGVESTEGLGSKFYFYLPK